MNSILALLLATQIDYNAGRGDVVTIDYNEGRTAIIDTAVVRPPSDGGIVPEQTIPPVVFFPDPTCPACNELAMRDMTVAGISYRVQDAPAWVTRKLPVVWWTDPKTGKGYHDTYRSVAQVQRAIGASPAVTARPESSGPPAVSHTTAGGFTPYEAPTPIGEVRRVLAILRPQSAETFVDYGCGDGRWLIEAARRYGCRAVGVEIDPRQAEAARRAVAEAGLSDRITIIEGDATRVQVQAHVGVAYLYPDLLQQLKPRLLKLRGFATYMHQVDGVPMRRDGDSWLWEKPVFRPVAQRPYAWYGGQAYTGRVCNNPRCSMCAAIARQLGQ